MNALLLASQLIIPTLPAGVNENNWVAETIKTYACVEAVEADGIVHTLDETTGADVKTVKLIVTAKSQRLVAKCAKQLVTELEGLKLEQTFTIIPAFVVSYEVPAELINNEKPVVGIETEVEVENDNVSTQVIAN